MVNYYKILKVSPKASAREIKSAYRRLAKEFHPDKNSDSPKATEDFALIAKAYQVLSDKRERAIFDDQMFRASQSDISIDDDSVFYSENQHARRLRRMTIQRRMDAVVDRLINEERAETLALQKAVYPTVALFVSTFFVAMVKPLFWGNSTIIGKIIVLTLFIIGVLHLVNRLREAFAHYTRDDAKLHDSIMRDEDADDAKPFTRVTAMSFLIGGTVASFGLGILAAKTFELAIFAMTPSFFSPTLQAELIFYPPIAVLIIDGLHAIAAKVNI